MAYDDPVTQKQLGYILNLAEHAIPDWSDEGDLDALVVPVYGKRARDLNRGQASMLIDDLKWEIGELESEPDAPSIFASRRR
ncbi:MAG: hypothetical protein JSR79_10255 [Proteobacteria bacterium]|nr:hypothetical protein [Pseudomonadota bacterium]